MKVNNENLEKILEKLISSTRSPRRRFSAENSWQILESKLFARRIKRRLWLRTASAAAIVLLCVASWAAYHALSFKPASPAAIVTESQSAVPVKQREVMVFSQQPLEEIVLQLSKTFHKVIRIENDSLKNYRMTATFGPDEEPAEILDLLKEAGNFQYKESNDTITITKLN